METNNESDIQEMARVFKEVLQAFPETDIVVLTHCCEVDEIKSTDDELIVLKSEMFEKNASRPELLSDFFKMMAIKGLAKIKSFGDYNVYHFVIDLNDKKHLFQLFGLNSRLLEIMQNGAKLAKTQSEDSRFLLLSKDRIDEFPIRLKIKQLVQLTNQL